jgi:proline iminopeptidase
LLSINGTELYVKRLGVGEPIVVVHGGPVLEHGYLLPHLAPLAESYELIFFDQRLSGRSAPGVDSASVRLATFVDDIAAVRQALGLDRIHLMAHSWGGLLAMHYALEHQEQLISLVLLNSMSPSSDLWQEEERLLAGRVTAADSTARATLRESQAFAAREAEAIRQMLLLSFKTQFHDPNRSGDLDIYVPDDYVDRSRQFGYMMVDLAAFDLRAELDRITVPTLLIYGSDEPAVTLGGSALREGLQNEEFVIIENAGHFPFIEQPEVFLLTVRKFLDARRSEN